MGDQTKMKIAVLGSNGMLGSAVSLYFKRQGWTVVYVTREKYDVLKTPIAILEGILSGHNVDAVVNCIGLTKPIIENYDKLEAILVNGLFPINLARYCDKYNIKCFHITTDCVFSGKKGDYIESDYSDAKDIYGISKALGDGANCMVLRTSIIGEEKVHRRHLLSWVIDGRGRPIRGYSNYFWNGITSIYLAEIIYNILSPDKVGVYAKGIYHIFSLGTISKKELLESINKVYDLDLDISPFQCETKCDRSLNTNNFWTRQSTVIKSLDLQLREMKEFFNAN